LKGVCSIHGMLPPTFGSNMDQPIKTLKTVQKRKRKNSK
jgi:hypothetical protein